MNYIEIIIHNGGEYVVLEDGQLRAVRKFYGTSDKEKPRNNVRTGDRLMEVDTKKIFMYDEEISDWRQIS